MKGRLDMATTPGLMSLPPAAAGSARWRLYCIMRRAYAISTTWYCAVARTGLSGVKVVTGEDAAATFLTRTLDSIARKRIANRVQLLRILRSMALRSSQIVYSAQLC